MSWRRAVSRWVVPGGPHRPVLRAILAVILGALVTLAALFLTGCASQAALVEQLAKDPASNCVVLSTPYGGILIARGTPGVRVNLAGGTCSIDAGPAR